MSAPVAVGDRVNVVNPDGNYGDYGVGSIGAVTAVGEGGIDVRWEAPFYNDPIKDGNRCTYLLHREYEIIPSTPVGPKSMTPINVKALEVIICSIPHPEHIRDIDLSGPDGALGFTWQGHRFFVADNLSVYEQNETDGDLAMVLERLLRVMSDRMAAEEKVLPA